MRRLKGGRGEVEKELLEILCSDALVLEGGTTGYYLGSKVGSIVTPRRDVDLKIFQSSCLNISLCHPAKLLVSAKSVSQIVPGTTW